MIIRVTFNDNDFTYILEKYFKYFKFQNYNLYYSNCSDLLEFKNRSIESDDLLHKIIYEPNKMTQQEIDRFIYIVIESIKEFLKLNYAGYYDYLESRIQVKVIDTCSDSWENGEVAYYFINKEVTIIA